MAEATYDTNNLSAQDREEISQRLVEEGLLVRTGSGTGYALTEKGRAWRAAHGRKPGDNDNG